MAKHVRWLAATSALILALCSLATWPAGAVAQPQPPITLDIHAGYDGGYRAGEWFAVAVNIANNGPDLNGVLEWSFPGQTDEQPFQRRIELPSGARKRVLLDVLASGYGRNGLVRLLDGPTELARQQVNLEAFDESIFLAGVVSSDPALLNRLDAEKIGSFNSTRVRHLDLGALPEAAAELRGLNALFLHDFDSAALSPQQHEAIELWVSQGGQLLVSGGVNAQKTSAGLLDLLPVALLGAIGQADLSPLAQLAGANAGALPANTTISQAQPRAGAEQLPANAGLLYRWRYGAGAVTFSTFDFASLRGWPGEGALWAPLLARQSIYKPGAAIGQLNLLDRGVLKLPSLRLPATSTILLFLLTYLLAIGPINYLVLRRLRRLELAWVSIPLIVLGFSAGLYTVGRVLRGGQPQFNQVAFVQAVEGHDRGGATAFVGLFSPNRATYTLGFPAASLVAGGASRLFENNQFDTVVADDTGARSVELLADIGAVTTLVAESAIDLPVRVQSNLALDGDGVQGEVRNTGTSALENVLVVRGERFAQLGALPPGASQSIASGSMQPDFPTAVALDDSGVFDRQEMLNLLFDRDALQLSSSGSQPNGSPGAEDVYLLAWSNQPAIAVSVNGQEASQNGLTLYIIHLATTSR